MGWALNQLGSLVTRPTRQASSWLVQSHHGSRLIVRKAFQPKFGARAGAGFEIALEPSKLRNNKKIGEKGASVSAPNSGMYQTLVQKRSEIARNLIGLFLSQTPFQDPVARSCRHLAPDLQVKAEVEGSHRTF